ncbi:MAG: hypothetical protein A4S08_06030 [Proteobacteria bacterium SG_bin4]|nr:MAG: hypothetical protein A4S08_06030 [Proteobacteria bacterium SG_bin4]
MSNKAGSINDLIAVPKGGGALKGVGEKFSPDLHTGTGNFTVPIVVPPGRNGFQPQLNLGYSTGSGNGSFGLGWNLSIPGVTRLTSKGVPQYRDHGTEGNSDIFVLSGAEDLVEISQTNEIPRRYKPRTEGLFAKIERWTTDETDYWTVRSKDGLISTYGSAEPSKICTVSDPAEVSHIFSWRLTETTDPFGNRIVYEYHRDRSNENRKWDQLYLERISYVDLEGSNQAPFLVTVEFIYDDQPAPAGIIPEVSTKTRPDPFSDYRAGFEIRTRFRCKWIIVRTHPEKNQVTPVRAYELIYLDEIADKADLPLNGLSLLSRINVIGFNDQGEFSREMPPLDFGYTRFTPGNQKFSTLTGMDLPATSLANPNLELVDLFGHGLPDILELGDTARFWRNLGNGKFDRPKTMPSVPAGLRLSDSGVQMLDANGDGRADLLVTTGDRAGYYALDFNAEWNRKSWRPYVQAPSFNLEDPEVRLLDLTGDGISDVLRSSTSFECYFNDPESGWLPKNTRRIQRQSLDSFPNVNFSDPRVKFADLSGDGLQDIAWVHEGRIDYWPNLGYGRWGGRITMSIPDHLPFQFDPARVILGDVDGDGLADLLYVSDREVMLWINRCGNGFSEPLIIQGTPSVTNMDTVRLTDLHGTGVAGILWSRDTSSNGQPNHFFLDLTGDVKPYLLNRMDNNLGAITEVTYASSTKFYLRDQEKPTTQKKPSTQEEPTTGWRSTLPFPVQVVERVTVRDELSGGVLTTEYRYHHGYWDGVEREFRGFGMVEQLDTEVFDAYSGRALTGNIASLQQLLAQENFAPPILTRTWFHQGPIDPDGDGHWHAMDYQQEYWDGDPSLLSVFPETPNALQIQRDAQRSLRGSILRSEVYALDGSPLQDRPYTVTEHAYDVREEEAQDEPTRLRIFFPFNIAQRTTQWERGEEPQTQLTFISGYDDVGQPARQLTIACPRSWRTLQDTPADGFLATLTHTQYATTERAELYLRDRVARSRGFELTQTPNKSVLQLVKTNESNSELRLIAESLNFYDGTEDAATNYGAFEGLPNGQVGKFGALVRTEALVMTKAHLEAAYGQSIPPYLQPDIAFQSTDEYLPAFVSTLTPLAGYRYRQATQSNAEGYFVLTASKRYDFHNATGKGHGLTLAQRDPFGHETTIDYDAYQLLPVKVTGPTGFTTQAEYDMRVFQPKRVIDPNNNVSEVTYSPSGLMSKTWMRGKRDASPQDPRNSGDREIPSLVMEYDLRAYYDSKRLTPNDPQPVFVRAIRRVFYDSDPDDTGETIEAREYSDGFGRLLQTRTQGEDIRFGDSVFGGGNAILPLDQTVASNKAIIGIRNTDPALTNVIVSGWQRYDNKGRVIEKYEPFYDTGWVYQPEQEIQLGQHATMYYDPRGQVIRTVNPDDSEQRVIYGRPIDLDNPPLSPWDTNQFIPTPWEAYTYDPNDNAGRTHGDQEPHTFYTHHWNTPASIETDALGRTIRAVARHRESPYEDGTLPPIEEHTTRSTYDIQGNLLQIRDALGRIAFEYQYDLAQHPLRTESIDAGRKLLVLDATGNPIESRDAKGALTLHTYDTLNRPTHLWARDDQNDPMSLREQLFYDHDITNPSDADHDTANNLLGKLWRHHDEAGIVTIPSYDFKSNILESARQVVSDDFMLASFRAQTGKEWKLQAPRLDWANPPDNLLDPINYRTRSGFDALNRIKWSEYPEAANGERYRLRPIYNRAGVLEQVDLEGPLDTTGQGSRKPYVHYIAYNAKGQRTLIAYGNGIMTRYAYDPLTFRLARLRSDRFDFPSAPSPEYLHFQPQGAPLQDIAYWYDLAGNILGMLDRTSGCGVAGNPEAIHNQGELREKLVSGDALQRCFEYDSLYRLISATGRESSDIPIPRSWSDKPRNGYNSGRHGTPDQDNAPHLTALYWEEYRYDAAGNMLTLRHNQSTQRNGSTGWETTWSRHFGMDGHTPDGWRREIADHLTDDWGNQPSNRLTHVQDRSSGSAAASTVPQSHFYDANGNMVQEHTERHFEWDHVNRLKVFRNQIDTSKPSSYALYLYDASGQRIKKLVVTGNHYRTTTYLGAAFEHHTEQNLNGAQKRENCTLHVMDDKSRIALVRVGPAFDDDGAAEHPIQYHLGDHLGSSAIVMSGEGNWMNREEFFPYGETSFGSFGRKRYRFTGKERDEESGLYYHQTRYYLGFYARWVSCDLLGAKDGLNSFQYVSSNPIRLVDPSGLSGEDAGISSKKSETNESPATHIIVVGTDYINVHNNPKNFSNAAVRYLSGKTEERFRDRVKPGDNIVVIVPPAMKSVSGTPMNDLNQALSDLQSRIYDIVVSIDEKGDEWGEFKNRPTVELVTVAGKDVVSKINSYKNIKTYAYFGHGASRPLYDNTLFGNAAEYDRSSFAPSPSILMCTCNSSAYAEALTSRVGGVSIGVEGTTWFHSSGVISAGKQENGNPSQGWRFEETDAGTIHKTPFNLTKVPILRSLDKI